MILHLIGLKVFSDILESNFLANPGWITSFFRKFLGDKMADQNLALKVIEVIVIGGILTAFILPLLSLLNKTDSQSSRSLTSFSLGANISRSEIIKS